MFSEENSTFEEHCENFQNRGVFDPKKVLIKRGGSKLKNGCKKQLETMRNVNEILIILHHVEFFL